MKRIIAAALAAVMLLALAGCSSGDDTAKLVGTWKGELGGSYVSDEMVAALGEETASYFDFSSFSISYTMIFNEDQTYCVTLTEEDARKAADDLMVIVEAGMVKMFEEQIALAGLDMTVDELLEMNGTTMDELMSESFDIDALVDELGSGTTSEGNYLAEDGKLYLSDSLDTKPSKLSYDEFTLKGNTLTLTNYVGNDSSFDWVYPMTLTREK